MPWQFGDPITLPEVSGNRSIFYIPVRSGISITPMGWLVTQPEISMKFNTIREVCCTSAWGKSRRFSTTIE